jgi:3-oxoacyl-[acyl-carrier-protein] synthase II
MKLSIALLAAVCAVSNSSTGCWAFTVPSSSSPATMTALTSRQGVVTASTSTKLTAATLETDTQLEKNPPKMYEKRRVVVTGLGVVNGCGIGHEEFFQACLDGKSSIDRVQRFDISYMPCTIGSEIKPEQFDAADWFTNPKNVKSNDRYTHLAVAAARQALRDAKLGDTPETLENPEMIGVMVGTAFGGMETFEQQTLKLAKNPTKPKVSLLKKTKISL